MFHPTQSSTSSLIHLMHAITQAHTSTCNTSLMHVKNSTCHFCLWHLNRTVEEENERTKTSNYIVDNFSLTFVNLSLTWNLHFHVWLQNKRKILIWEKTIISLAYVPVYSLHLQQNNLNNPDAYSESCQTCKMECFAKLVTG